MRDRRFGTHGRYRFPVLALATVSSGEIALVVLAVGLLVFDVMRERKRAARRDEGQRSA
jgi:hypothetical protein